VTNVKSFITLGPDGADLNGDVVGRNVRVDGMKAGVKLTRSQSKTGANAEQGGLGQLSSN